MLKREDGKGGGISTWPRCLGGGGISTWPRCLGGRIGGGGCVPVLDVEEGGH